MVAKRKEKSIEVLGRQPIRKQHQFPANQHSINVTGTSEHFILRH